VHEAKVTGASEIEVWGPATARREFTYVEDLASWVAASVGEVANLPGILNLGIGMDYFVGEFYSAAMEAIEFEVKLVDDVSKPEGMKAKLMDSSKARINNGWNAHTDLVAGFKRRTNGFSKVRTKMQGSKYPLATTTWDEAEINSMQEVIQSGNFTMGTRVRSYESEFADLFWNVACCYVKLRKLCELVSSRGNQVFIFR